MEMSSATFTPRNSKRNSEFRLEKVNKIDYPTLSCAREKSILFHYTLYTMRPYEKNIDKVPDAEEVLSIIDEHADLVATERTSRVIQQILDL